MTKLDVLVIGGGIGGLSLAQGLKKAGVSVAVYERDGRRPRDCRDFEYTSAPEGVRRYMNACRPSCGWFSTVPAERFRAGFTMVTEQLKELLHATSDDDGSTEPADCAASLGEQESRCGTFC